jgi:uncharacterized protein YjbI with pentapeptide repeats
LAALDAWERCTTCPGARIDGDHCLAHLTGAELDRQLERWRRGEALDARGVTVTAELLATLLGRLKGRGGGPRLAAADFREASFAGDVDFSGARFSGVADFSEAVFGGDVDFSNARFEGGASFIRTEFEQIADFHAVEFAAGAGFGGARFSEPVWFAGASVSGKCSFTNAWFASLASFAKARFARDVIFHGAEFSSGPDCAETEFLGEAGFSTTRFGGVCGFGRARFAGPAHFVSTQFGGDAHFLEARFERHSAFAKARFAGDAVFLAATFAERATFADAWFGGPARFPRARFSGDAVFTRAEFRAGADFSATGCSADASVEEATFARPARLGPLVVAGTLALDGATFEDDVVLAVAAGALTCRATRFAGRADLNVRWAEVALDNATFARRALLTGVEPFAKVDEAPAQAGPVERRLDAQARPRLVSVRQAAIENLTLGNIDLRACRFSGAHGLDQLRIEADCDFAAQPPARRYTRRQTLAEEHHWRAGRTRGWHPPECQPPEWLERDAPVRVLTPANIGSLYRLLRKALEDRKDEPGAADFYYGEMEMRRHHARDRPERAVLALYWLVSGYGLRALRALLCLAITVLACALLLDWFGFRADRSYGRSLLFAVESSVGLLRAPEAELRAGGEIVQIVLRLAGPLFFGLALLALRGRVKR